MRIYRSGHYSFSSPHNKNIDEIIRTPGNEVREFRLTPKAAKIFQSRAMRLFYEQQHTPQTQILTYQVDHDSTPYPDLNRYLTNLRSNHGLHNYVTALEVTKKKQYHFHIIADMPRIDTKKVNRIWTRASKTKQRGNALRDHRSVKHRTAVIKYCSDYLSKKGSKDHKLRKFSNSRNLSGQEYLDISDEMAYKMIREKEIRKISEHKLEYCTVGRLFLDENIENIFKSYYNSEAN